jgi:N-acetylmuramoyl-L-alanine amidase
MDGDEKRESTVKTFQCFRTISGILALGCALLMAAPVAAHPGSLWGIDLPSVIALRDQARVAVYNQTADHAERDHLQRVQTIVIDPGHGGDNSGATGVAGVAEKHLTLELAYALREELQTAYPDLRVILTRYWDASVEIPHRVHLANLAEADLLISLHYNAATHDRALGFETFFLRPEDITPGEEQIQGLPVASVDSSVTGIERPIEGARLVGQHGDTLILIQQDLLRAHQHALSGRLAETIQDRFRAHLDSIDRGVKQANFSILRGAHMPAVVVEAGFLTHPVEGLEVLTTAHRDRIVRSLVEAITLFDLELAATLQPEPAGPAPALENSDEEAPLDEAQLTGDETPNAPVS